MIGKTAAESQGLDQGFGMPVICFSIKNTYYKRHPCMAARTGESEKLNELTVPS
jgi:hypothetical protein